MGNILLTLDYELFFGNNSGTLEKCIINPTNRFINLCSLYGAKATFFVDAGYICKLIEYKNQFPSILNDYNLICNQLTELSKAGHDIQLHIHPHWEDSTYTADGWKFDTRRFKLNDFADDEIETIVSKYKQALSQFSDNITSFRAGGWCIQPFSRLAKIFKNNGISVDSTVYYGGYDLTDTHYYDFRNAPVADSWKFEDDPIIENRNGYFTEIPISSCVITPLHYWKLAVSKLIRSDSYRQFGDGSPIYASSESILKKIFTYTYGVVSMDGIKSDYLEKAYKKHNKNPKNNIFVVIGHPKAFSKYSLSKLEKFIKKNSNNEFITINQIVKGKK